MSMVLMLIVCYLSVVSGFQSQAGRMLSHVRSKQTSTAEAVRAATAHSRLRHQRIAATTNNASPSSTGPPSALFIAGLPEQYFETLDDIFAVTLAQLPPVIILNQDDFIKGTTVRRILGDADLLNTRDHMICGQPCDLPAVVIIFSGFNRPEVMLSIQSYRSWDSPQLGKLPPAAFAVVVPPALDKSWKLLCEEICRDFSDETQQGRSP